ncbi:hypothetical protein [Streptococcus sp. 2018162]|uniref:hypothetical protein n=1 Tax=Streptococcus sp. 2018162 TaxID=2870783 RepID=UPI001C8E5C5B|nr:hypothetical protein [Streptococcus sp. 2018162]MBY0730790.1 hypothetical protein [Streptococcus sp. 2018162]
MGCDFYQAMYSAIFTDFNPRTRMGCDSLLGLHLYMTLISIHAPVWGATGLISNDYISSSISIHAPVWGATLDKI